MRTPQETREELQRMKQSVEVNLKDGDLFEAAISKVIQEALEWVLDEKKEVEDDC